MVLDTKDLPYFSLETLAKLCLIYAEDNYLYKTDPEFQRVYTAYKEELLKRIDGLNKNIIELEKMVEKPE